MERSGIVRSDLKDFTAEVAESAEFTNCNNQPSMRPLR